jgi:hypothetical protein
MRLALLLSSFAVALLACSSDSGGSTGNGGAASTATGCAADHRKDIYTAGLTKPAGAMSVKLLDSDPGPPIKGTNELTIEVLDASGQPVDGATVTVTPWMPDHAHGSAVKPTVTPAGGGKYTVANVYLSMAGLWQLKVDVQPAGGSALPEAIFQFCLDG